VIQLYQGSPKTKGMELIQQHPLSNNSDKVFLKIEAARDKYSFSYAEKKNQWKVLKNDVDGKFLSTNVAGGFVGTLFGVYATSSGEPSQNTATFKWFGYSGNDKTYAP